MQKTISPIDNKVYIEREYDSHKIEETLNNSVKAQISWGQISVKERVELLGKFVEDFLSKKEIITEELCRQIGRPISQVAGELNGFKERADYMLSIAENKLADIDVTKDNNFKNFIRRKPLGVVFVIAPWNYPYLTAVNSIIPAMAAGNCVILKHSAQTPLCAEQLYQSAQKTLPKDVFNFLHLNHKDGLKVVSDSRINFVSFTGSVKAGYEVQKATHTKFIDMALELGGKDPAYARYDCDLEKTVENLVDGSFFNSGQSCCGIERIYVDEKIYDKFLESFISKTYNYNFGNPLKKETNLGPVVKLSAAEFIINQMNSAIDKGAKKMIDENKFNYPKEHKNYLVPQGVLLAFDMSQALALANGDNQPFVIGGGEIYRLGMEWADCLEITHIDGTFDCDTYFPKIEADLWKCVSEVPHPKDERHDYAFKYCTYQKIKNQL